MSKKARRLLWANIITYGMMFAIIYGGYMLDFNIPLTVLVSKVVSWSVFGLLCLGAIRS